MHVEVAALIAHLQVQAGRAQSSDLIFFNLESVLRDIYSFPWPWSVKREQFSLPANVTETQLFTWTAGDDYITAAAVLTDLTNEHVGRVVYIGTTWYRVIGLTNDTGPQVKLDRILLESSSEPTQLTFVRRDFCIHTSNIITLGTNKVASMKRWNPEPFERAGQGKQDFSGEGEPEYYNDRRQFQIPPPQAPPVADGVHAGSMLAGTYYFFFTRVDKESGYESAPGPMYKHVQSSSAAGQAPVIKYKDALDEAEQDVSYTLRLYMSERSPDRLPCRMSTSHSSLWERGNTTSPISVSYSGINYQFVPYWSGIQTVCTMYPVPTDEIRQYHVSYHEAFGTIFRGDEFIYLGDDSSLYELILQYLTGKLGSSARSPDEERKANMHYRAQLQYILSKTKEAAEQGDTRENHVLYYPGKGLDDNSIESLFPNMVWEDE